MDTLNGQSGVTVQDISCNDDASACLVSFLDSRDFNPPTSFDEWYYLFATDDSGATWQHQTNFTNVSGANYHDFDGATSYAYIQEQGASPSLAFQDLFL